VDQGKYSGDICLVVGNDLVGSDLLEHQVIRDNNVIVKHFPNIKFTDRFLQVQEAIPRPHHWNQKMFQYHKFYLFNTYFKQWDRILYLDCGITIFSDISPILNEYQENTLLAHSDAYPTYVWKLHTQFVHDNVGFFDELCRQFNLGIDYFQTTMMLFDTKIIQDNTVGDLITLAEQHPVGITNDQAYISLYFTNVKPLWKQIRTRDDFSYFYDYLSREPSNKYIMLKCS
jgi:lipopolysaccharide biosynthesis glycosyltransferase